MKDYKAFARQRKIRIWGVEKARRESREKGEIREVAEIWQILRATSTLPDNPNFPNLPNSPELAVNLLITLISQANFLIDKLTTSLLNKHKTEGGFTEKLYQKRTTYRGY